jgi:hypothetical protein
VVTAWLTIGLPPAEPFPSPLPPEQAQERESQQVVVWPLTMKFQPPAVEAGSGQLPELVREPEKPGRFAMSLPGQAGIGEREPALQLRVEPVLVSWRWMLVMNSLR